MGGKVAMHEAHHSPTSSAEVMKNGAELYTHSHCTFMAWTGITLHTDQFTLKIATSRAKYEWQITVLYSNTVKYLSGLAGEKGVQIHLFC
jgi:hypothetical protein